MSLFRYISSKKRYWLYTVGYFMSSLLSSYFWTTYLVIMGDNPNASDALTYFGWNVSYIMMLVLLLHSKTKEERRYFNFLMLIPIPLNIWQLTLYLEFGGIILSIYQVSICTLVACLCIQSIMWYIKNRKKGANKPYISAVLLFNIVTEFGMWTASCYEGWADNVYYLSSLLCSVSYLMMIRAVKKTYKDDSDGTEVSIDRRIQNILKGSYIATVTICSLGGIILGSWIRDMLSEGEYGENGTEVYDIIHVLLFLTSIILAAFAIVIILIVYFEQKITENNRLREEKRVAEQSNAAKSDFLATMSHEIRTPINAVLGMNKMIMRDSLRAGDVLPKDRETIRRIFSDITGYSGNIDSAGNNLLCIINDILDFSKIEAGKFDLSEREYMFSSVLNDVSITVLFKAREKGLGFSVETDSDIPDCLFGDDVRIRQIITNILNNAVKYTDKGGVTLSVHGSGGYKDGETAEIAIAVKDTGIGIKQEDIDKIFDKFERTDLDRNNTVEGTGLGLAITHRLTAMMKGSISVESEYGRGSVFTIRLPQRVVSAQPIGNFSAKFEKSFDEFDPAENIFRAPEARILIADDTRMNLLVAAGLLKDTEIKTDTAESGAKALELSLSVHYDLILMDQRMPVMDGIETLHRLREQENGLNRETPVICLTADALTGAKEHYLSEGFDDYLSKPIDSREMKKTIMKYLPAEKILPACEGAAEGSAVSSSAADGLYAALHRIDIDTEKGLGYCQDSEELYRTMLLEYVHSASEKLESLKSCYAEKDPKNYGIIVHSLKSTSRTIGAEEIAELSAALEKAADGERWDIISGSHSALIEKLGSAVGRIAEALGGEEAYPGEASAEEDDDEIIEFFPE